SMFDPRFFDPSKAAVVDPRTGAITSGDLYNGIVLPGTEVPSAEGNRIPLLHSGEFSRLYHGLPDGLAKTHKNTFQPRLGIAYAVNDKTAVRAGVGMFLNRTMINRDLALGGNAPFEPQQLVSNGVVDDPGGAGSTKRNFPFSLSMQDPILKIPTAWNWNFTVERELPWSMKAEIGYVGRVGLHNQLKRNINQLLPGTCPNGTCPLIDPANPALGRFNVSALRPFRGLGVINLAENAGRSRYNGLQVNVERRSARGLQVGVSYTLSRSRDNA